MRRTEEAVKKIDQLNQPKLGSGTKECQHCLKFSKPGKLKSEQEEDLRQQCAIDLCGPANKNPKYIWNNTNFDKVDIDPEIAEQFDKTILPTVKKAIQDRLDHENNILKLVKDKLKNPNANIKPEEWDKTAEYLYDSVTPMTPHFNDDKEKKDFFTEKYKEFLKEYENKKPELTEDDKKEITRLNRELKNDDIDVDNFVESLNDLMRKIKTDSCSKKPSCKRWVHGELSHHYQTTIRQKEQQSTEDRISKAIKYCRSGYTVSKSDALRSKPFRENLEDYKKRFLDGAFSNYSQPSQQAFGNYMNEPLKINLLSGKNLDSVFIDSIKQITSRALEAQKTTSPLQNVYNLIFDLDPVCPSSVRGEFASLVHYSTNTVHMSVFSCAFHEHGKQVFAHELAHAMSYLFANNKLSKKSYDKYNKLRQCASKMYKINNKAPHIKKDKDGKNIKPIHKHDKYKTEEDTADLVAYQVFQNDPTLFHCSVFRSDQYSNKLHGLKPDEYLNIRIVDPKYFSSIHEPDYNGDTHSETLLRVIMEAIHKRMELPESCQQVVDIYSDRINFEPCF